ncbi:MAG TPA: cbb3-type cytochrome oxidase assembly protein CcoS, partial [Alphaproteobacteria bacterium]|nr:cbb3-type cytochrome oxidase assembly protein CcoS [Alphaproteobacteria bacterium]
WSGIAFQRKVIPLQPGSVDMDILLLLIPCAMMLGVVALGAFFWSLNAKQYEDLDGAAERILIDDDQPTDGLQSESTTRPR